jgi:hypothetical protein
MTKHYPLQTRNMIVRMKMVCGLTYRKIQEISQIPRSTAHRWVRSSVICKRSRERQIATRKWNEQVHQILKETLDDNPFRTFNELKNIIRDKLPKSAPSSSSTIHFWLKHRMHVSRKRVSGKYVVHNNNVKSRVMKFVQDMAFKSIDEFVSIDEMSVYFSEHSRYGYTRKGIPLRGKQQSKWSSERTRRITLLMATSSTRVVHHSVFDGAFNSERFEQFIDTLPKDCPKYMLMDNVSFHKTHAVSRAMQKRSLIPIFVPPYSPQYNPIEYVFSYVKRILRRISDSAGRLQYEDISRTCTSIPEHVVWNSFAHCMKLCSHEYVHKE